MGSLRWLSTQVRWAPKGTPPGVSRNRHGRERECEALCGTKLVCVRGAGSGERGARIKGAGSRD
jgi:hypothetical protein